MLDIFAPLAWLCPDLKVTTVGHLSRIIGAMWAMTGRVTMVGRARWAGDGCTDRPVPRFLSTVMAWPVFLGVFFRPPGLDPTETDGLSWGCVCGDHVRQEDVWGGTRVRVIVRQPCARVFRRCRLIDPPPRATLVAKTR
jgi:hypothetical protein